MDAEPLDDPRAIADFDRCLVISIPVLLRRAKRFHSARAAAEDLVQDTLCKALSRREQYDPSQAMATWLIAIMRNSYIDDYRMARRTPVVSGSVVELSPAVAAHQEWCMQAIEVDIALRAIEPLNRVALMRIAIGDTYQEVAVMTGMEVGTVKTRVRRTRQKLHARFGSIFPTWENRPHQSVHSADELVSQK